MYSGPVWHCWPLLICEWFEMFEAHSWHCLPALPLSGLWWRVWGLGGATREIWLENSHRRPHTASRDGTLPLRQDKNNHRIQRQNFCFNCNVLIESWLYQLSLLRTFIFSVSISFPYPRVWSEPQHDKWQVRHLHSSSPLSNLDWEYWIHVRKFEFSRRKNKNGEYLLSSRPDLC